MPLVNPYYAKEIYQKGQIVGKFLLKEDYYI